MAEICRDRAGDNDEKVATIRCLRFKNTNEPDEKLLLFASNFGWIYIEKIINNSDNTVHYNNPYLDLSGDINPGSSEDTYCTGYLPYWSYDNRYEINYYNTTLKEKKKILIKDLDGDWLASFNQEGNDEDIREVRPGILAFKAFVTIVFLNSGYEVYEDGNRKGGMYW